MYKEFEGIEESDLSPQEYTDKKIISSMISELQWIIDWLDHGRQPGIRRAIDRRDAYKKMLIKDPRLIEALPNENSIMQEPEGEISDWDKQRIEDALSVLTKREKEIYILHYVQLYSLQEIANIIEVKKGTVQSYIKRAERKMKRRMNESLFCLA